MKKHILTAVMIAASMTAYAETEVMKITLKTGEVTSIAVSDIEEMTFALEDEPAPEPTMAEKYAGVYGGTQEITVGGQFTYSTWVEYTLTAEEDGTLTVSIPEYSLANTQMGDLTLGAVTIKGLEYDEAKGGFYRMYANDGIMQHFLAVNGGTTMFDKDYELGGESSIFISLTDKTIHVENPFKLGAMPLPMTGKFEGTIGAEKPEPTMAEKYAGVYNGTQKVIVGGQFTYETTVAYTLTAGENGTLTVSIPQYSLSNTMMGDLTLGAVTISGLEYDEAKGGFYRMYANDGIKQHFKAEKDGTSTMDNDYELGGESNILITLTDNKINVTNPFKLGAMPLSLTAEFEGSK
ncbi:MAG: calycin-like domain-containing protein [Prevotella sp.]|nr:calycin-like domain-containing protein [Prevotella sp.]MCM1074558.1 calycin-like domain-containing protein [Ruminococcus sp.]